MRPLASQTTRLSTASLSLLEVACHKEVKIGVSCKMFDNVKKKNRAKDQDARCKNKKASTWEDGDAIYKYNYCMIHCMNIPYKTLHHRPTIPVWACHDSSARMCLHWLARTKAKKRNMSTASESALYQKSG